MKVQLKLACVATGTRVQYLMSIRRRCSRSTNNLCCNRKSAPKIGWILRAIEESSSGRRVMSPTLRDVCGWENANKMIKLRLLLSDFFSCKQCFGLSKPMLGVERPEIWKFE